METSSNKFHNYIISINTVSVKLSHNPVNPFSKNESKKINQIQIQSILIQSINQIHNPINGFSKKKSLSDFFTIINL